MKRTLVAPNNSSLENTRLIEVKMKTGEIYSLVNFKIEGNELSGEYQNQPIVLNIDHIQSIAIIEPDTAKFLTNFAIITTAIALIAAGIVVYSFGAFAGMD